MSRYLVDNSVLQRLPRSPNVQAAVGALLDAEHETVLLRAQPGRVRVQRTLRG